MGEAIIELHKIARTSNWSKTSLDSLYKLLKGKLLPKENKLPSNVKAVSKLLAPYGVGYKVVPCCQNDCVVFDGEYGGSEICPHCRIEAFDPDDKPHKVFRQTPLPAVIRQLFQCPDIANDLKAPVSNSDRMEDIWGMLRPSASQQVSCLRWFPSAVESASCLRLLTIYHSQ